jgi:hypothetical protein
MNQSLMRAVAEYAIFLGLAKEEDVNPDVAVEQLEQLSRIMKQLTQTEREEFANFTRKMAEQESQVANYSEERVEFLQSLVDNMGLDE